MLQAGSKLFFACIVSFRIDQSWIQSGIREEITIGLKSRLHVRMRGASAAHEAPIAFASWANAMLTSPYPRLKFAFGEFLRLR